MNSTTSVQRPRGKVKFLCLYAAFIALLFLVLAGASEVAVRIFVPERYWRFRTLMDDWQPDAELGWVNKANLDVQSRSDGRTLVRFHLNKDGLQPASATEAKDSKRLRIMLIGDSTVVGRAVPEDERLAPQLESALAARGLNYEVICAGVQGYSTDQELLMMRRMVPRYHPDIVIQMVCDNDFGGNETQAAYGLPKPSFTLDASGGLEFHAPAATTRLSPDGARGTGIVRGFVQRLAVYRLIQPGLQRLRAGRDWRQQNLLGADDSNMTESFLAHVNWKLFDALMMGMKTVCDENKAAFIFTQHPSRGEVWNEPPPGQSRFVLQERLQETAKRLGLRFCPVIPEFLNARQEGPFHIPPANPHCNGKGYEVTARILANYIKAEVNQN